jgi:hypothetical protein
MDVKKSPCPLTKGELSTRHRRLDEALVGGTRSFIIYEGTSVSSSSCGVCFRPLTVTPICVNL